MNLTQAEVEELQNLIEAAARRVAGQWPGTVERDDLEQEMYVHLLERPGSLDRLFEEPNQQVRQSFLIKMGHQIASDMQADYDRFSGNYLYDAVQVRKLLENQVWLKDDVKSTEKVDLAEGLGLLAEKNSRYYSSVVDRFVHDLIPESGSGEFKVIERAIGSLTALMNQIGRERLRRHSDGPGSRKALSNSQAEYATEIGPT